jgi:hypothetical protein
MSNFVMAAAAMFPDHVCWRILDYYALEQDLSAFAY